MNRNLSSQFKPVVQPAGHVEYPVKGWQKKSDSVTAQQRLMGAGRGYDVQADMVRKGIKPSMN